MRNANSRVACGKTERLGRGFAYRNLRGANFSRSTSFVFANLVHPLPPRSFISFRSVPLDLHTRLRMMLLGGARFSLTQCAFLIHPLSGDPTLLLASSRSSCSLSYPLFSTLGWERCLRVSNNVTRIFKPSSFSSPSRDDRLILTPEASR